jgi:membrane peptidoglycan carboxypeptidase
LPTRHLGARGIQHHHHAGRAQFVPRQQALRQTLRRKFIELRLTQKFIESELTKDQILEPT